MAFDRKLRDVRQAKREQASRRLYPTAEGVSIVLLLAALLLYSLLTLVYVSRSPKAPVERGGDSNSKLKDLLL